MKKLEAADSIRSKLRQHFATSAYHNVGLRILLTDGAFEMFELCRAYWLLDIIESYQIYPKIAKEDFQVWQLTIDEDNGGKIVCRNGNNKILAQQELDVTDFPLAEGITLWNEGNVLLLPTEH